MKRFFISAIVTMSCFMANAQTISIRCKEHLRTVFFDGEATECVFKINFNAVIQIIVAWQQITTGSPLQFF